MVIPSLPVRGWCWVNHFLRSLYYFSHHQPSLPISPFQSIHRNLLVRCNKSKRRPIRSLSGPEAVSSLDPHYQQHLSDALEQRALIAHLTDPTSSYRAGPFVTAIADPAAPLSDTLNSEIVRPLPATSECIAYDTNVTADIYLFILFIYSSL